MRGGTLSRVVASKSPNAKEGDIVNAAIGWTEYKIVSDKEIEKLEVPKGGQITDLIGVLGMFPVCFFLFFNLLPIVFGGYDAGDTTCTPADARLRTMHNAQCRFIYMV